MTDISNQPPQHPPTMDDLDDITAKFISEAASLRYLFQAAASVPGRDVLGQYDSIVAAFIEDLDRCKARITDTSITSEQFASWFKTVNDVFNKDLDKLALLAGLRIQ